MWSISSYELRKATVNFVIFVRPHETTRVPGQDADDNTTPCVRFACWVTKATDTRSEYAILIAFPLHNGYERLSVTLYVHCLSCFILNEGVNGPTKVKQIPNVGFR